MRTEAARTARRSAVGTAEGTRVDAVRAAAADPPMTPGRVTAAGTATTLAGGQPAAAASVRAAAEAAQRRVVRVRELRAATAVRAATGRAVVARV